VEFDALSSSISVLFVSFPSSESSSVLFNSFKLETSLAVFFPALIVVFLYFSNFSVSLAYLRALGPV